MSYNILFRFVRFISTPEVLERFITIEREIENIDCSILTNVPLDSQSKYSLHTFSLNHVLSHNVLNFDATFGCAISKWLMWHLRDYDQIIRNYLFSLILSSCHWIGWILKQVSRVCQQGISSCLYVYYRFDLFPHFHRR